MAKASEQFRQSDVATWGIVALAVAGLAVVGANISAVLPSGVLASLHKTRLEGASVDQLRLTVADLRTQMVELKRDNGVLAARFALEEQQGNDMTRRLGALEVSIPRLLEALPADAQIDRTNLTAAIPEAETLTFPAEGGTVAVQQRPLPTLVPATPIDPVETGAISSNPSAFGIAIGPPITAAQGPATWRDLSMKLGPLLFGLQPLLTADAGSDSQRILAGPIGMLGEATDLCERLERVSISCQPLPFSGTPMSLE